MLEVTIDLDWADDRYPFVRESKNYGTLDRPRIMLLITDDVKIEGHPTNLREFAAQIIAACDTHYPLEATVQP